MYVYSKNKGYLMRISLSLCNSYTNGNVNEQWKVRLGSKVEVTLPSHLHPLFALVIRNARTRKSHVNISTVFSSLVREWFMSKRDQPVSFALFSSKIMMYIHLDVIKIYDSLKDLNLFSDICASFETNGKIVEDP